MDTVLRRFRSRKEAIDWANTLVARPTRGMGRLAYDAAPRAHDGGDDIEELLEKLEELLAEHIQNADALEQANMLVASLADIAMRAAKAAAHGALSGALAGEDQAAQRGAERQAADRLAFDRRRAGDTSLASLFADCGPAPPRAESVR